MVSIYIRCLLKVEGTAIPLKHVLAGGIVLVEIPTAADATFPMDRAVAGLALPEGLE